MPRPELRRGSARAPGSRRFARQGVTRIGKTQDGTEDEGTGSSRKPGWFVLRFLSMLQASVATCNRQGHSALSNPTSKRSDDPKLRTQLCHFEKRWTRSLDRFVGQRATPELFCHAIFTASRFVEEPTLTTYFGNRPVSKPAQVIRTMTSRLMAAWTLALRSEHQSSSLPTVR